MRLKKALESKLKFWGGILALVVEVSAYSDRKYGL